MDVLLYVDADPLMEARSRAALSLVQACGGHVNCLQITAPMSVLSGGPPGVAGLLTEKVARRQWHKEVLRTGMEARLDASGVGWSYRAMEGDPARVLAEEVRLVDMVVLNAGRLPSELNGSALAAGELVSRLPVPVMAAPVGEDRFDAGGAALIAWDGTRPCDRSVRSALELLKAARAIFIVTIGEEKTGALAEDARDYLAHHRLRAEVVRRPGHGRPVSACLLEALQTCRAAYLVMGAYGRGRTRELLLGGVTREMLVGSPVPVVMAH